MEGGSFFSPTVGGDFGIFRDPRNGLAYNGLRFTTAHLAKDIT